MKKGNLQSGHAKRGQRLFLLSFIVLIVVGALLLWIPGMYMENGRIETLNWLDALFTSTSAVCVTGLACKPISNFSFWGQLVILLLIQAGGLGIMTLSASILLALGKGLSFSNSLMVSNLNDNFSLRGTESLLRTVMIYTFVAEAVGFIAILPGMLLSTELKVDFLNIGFWKRLSEVLWNSLFLSVSSFCNSGMTTLPDSLESVHWAAKLPAALLAITGGLGVYVIYDLVQKWHDRTHRLRVHSKLVICTTFVLLAAGTIAIYFLSNDGELSKNVVKAGNGVAKAKDLGWLDAFCFSVTSRTCGWNTAPMERLSDPATWFIMVLMLIGGSPGSTAGGIKTSTVALALAGIFGTLRGDPETIVFKRRIPSSNVLRAQAIIIIFVILSVIGALALEQMESRNPKWESAGDDAIFEAVSALTTTGLSKGNTTSHLSHPGKGLLVLFMFLGRVGPFTALLFLMGREKRGKLKYPEERVIIG